MPDQNGRVVVVTGASGGIGLETARAFALRGATVVLACRDAQKGMSAVAAIAAEGEGVDRDALHVVALDLASLGSVRKTAAEISFRFPRLDLLVNNAGVMSIPFQLSEDGVELTFATNHLGHFALTGLLLDRLLATSGSRVVTVSSNAHKRGEPQFRDLRSRDGYDPGFAYDRSKLANLLFTFELQRRLADSDATTVAVASHPGNARTDLWRTSSWFERVFIGPRLRLLTGWLAQHAKEAALPTLRAATDPAVRGGDYYGPAGRFEYTGHPVPVEASTRAHDRKAQRQLWQISEKLVGVPYPLPIRHDQ